MVQVGNRTYRELASDASGCMAGIVKNTEEFLNLLSGMLISYYRYVI